MRSPVYTYGLYLPFCSTIVCSTYTNRFLGWDFKAIYTDRTSHLFYFTFTYFPAFFWFLYYKSRHMRRNFANFELSKAHARLYGRKQVWGKKKGQLQAALQCTQRSDRRWSVDHGTRKECKEDCLEKRP